MNIAKYNIPKDNSTSASGGIYSGSTSRGTTSQDVSDSAQKLAETHYIFGQPFDGTQDVSGDLKNVQNIFAEGGDVYVKATEDGSQGGNIYADGEIKGQNLYAEDSVKGKNIEGEKITASSEVITPLITATNGNIDTVKSTLVDTQKLNVSVQAFIKELLAEDITVDNLTVTKAAHFFKLVIDEIKASQGAVIITPANGTIAAVDTISGGWRCYIRSKDADGKQVYNTFEKNDQIICQTFNAATGTSYNVSNTYYWRLCTNVGTGVTKVIDGQSVECHYIDLSSSDQDKYSNQAPKAGDEIVQLGNRTDTSRQAAIIISAYNNTYLDPELKAPSIVQYDGIKTFELKPYRVNVISKGYNLFKGTFTATNGKDIEDLISDVDKKADEYTDTYLHTAWANSADGSKDFTKNNNGGDYLYIGFKSDFNESDATLTYKDYKWSKLKGDQGVSVNITSKSVTYQVSNSGTVVPTGTWLNNVPQTDAGQYLWTRTIVNYSDGNSTTSYSVSRNGNNGTSVTITEKSVTYQVSTSGTTIPTGTWKTDIPTVPKGQYLWTKTYVKYSDGTETTSYSVSYNAVNGDDAEYYTISPIIEKAIVDQNGTLGVQFQYQIIHIKGSTTETITASKSGYWVRVKPDNSNTYYDLSVNTTTPTYTNTSYLKDYHKATSKPIYFTAYLVYGTSATVKDRSTIPVVFDAAATLTITDNIKSTVQGYKKDLDDLSGTVSKHTSSISTIEQNYNSIKSTVDSHTTSINTLTGEVSDLQDDYSTLEQTAKGLSSTVSSHTTSINNLTNTVSSHTTSISNLTQTANGLTSTVSSFSHSNLFIGSGDGTDWTIYDGSLVDYDAETNGFNTGDVAITTKQYVNGVLTDVTNHYYKIYSPVVYLTKGVTYTVTQYNNYSKYFTIRYSTTKTAAKNVTTGFSGITTGTVSSDTYKGYPRYKQTFTAPITGWYCFSMEDTQERKPLFYRPQLEEGADATPFNMAQLLSESQIKQAADEISLKVKNTGIDIDAEQITLNGNTQVNGTLTLTDSDQGFVLQGSGGTTTISPQSIGSYYSFKSKANSTNICNKQTLVHCGSAVAGGGTTTTFSVNNTYNLGTIKAGKIITLSAFSCSVRRYNSGDSPLAQSNQSHQFRIYQDDVLVSTYTATTNSVTGNFLQYTTTKAGEVKINLIDTSTVSITTLKNDKTPLLQVSQYFKVSIPTDAFTLIGYDGIGMNFGTNNTVYFGSEGAYLRYGTNELKVSENGIQKLDPNGSGNYVNLSNVKITRLTTSTDYTVKADDEFIVYSGTSSDITVTLPLPSQNAGRRIFFKDKSDGRAFKLSGYLTGTASPNSSTTTYTVNNTSVFAVCDGLSWVIYNCQ